MRGRRARAAATVLAACLPLTGCWNAIPLGHRALIQILAVDPAGGRDLRWTFFQASAAALSEMASGGGTSGPGSTASDQVTPVSVRAPTLADAYRRAQAITSRDLYLGQLQQVVLSERLTPAQLRLAIDSLAHTAELDQSQDLFAAPAGAAATILRPDPQELFPAAYLDHVANCPTCTTVSMTVSLMEAFVRTRVGWGTLVLPEVQPSPLGLSVRGAAVYAGGRLVARLGEEQAALLGLLRGLVTKTALSFAVPGVGRCSVRSVSARSHVHAEWRGGRVLAQVRVDLTGDILSVEPDLGRPFVALARPVNAALAREVAGRGARLLAPLLARGADPLGFGHVLWDGDPSAAPSPSAWRQGLGRAQVRITVHSDLRSEGVVR